MLIWIFHVTSWIIRIPRAEQREAIARAQSTLAFIIGPGDGAGINEVNRAQKLMNSHHCNMSFKFGPPPHTYHAPFPLPAPPQSNIPTSPPGMARRFWGTKPLCAATVPLLPWSWAGP